MTKRCAIYVRVSSDQQSEHGTSLASQRKDLSAYAKKAGWRVVKVYEDAAVSGAKKVEQRPALAELMASARGGGFDVLLVAAWDRLARNLREQVNLWGDLDDLGIEYFSLAEPSESGEDGAFMRHVIAAVAEKERNTIKARTTKGRRAVVEAGQWGGGDLAPFGYRVVDKQLRPDPEEAATVHRLVSLLVDEGKATSEVADILNAEGRMPRKAPRWTMALVRNHAARSIDIWSGVWRYGKGTKAGEIVVNLPEPVLTADRAEALRLVVKATATVRSANGVHPLTGRIICGDCGRLCTGIKRADGRARRYVCSNSKGQKTGGKEHRCKSPAIHGPNLDAAVWGALRPYLDRPELLLAEAAAVASDGALLPAAEATVEATRKVLGDVTTRGIKMGLDDDTIAGMVASARQDYDAAVKYRDEVAQQIAMASASSAAIVSVAEMTGAVLDDPTEETMRDVFRALDVMVTVKSYKPIKVQATGRVPLGTATVAPKGAGHLSLANLTSRNGRNTLGFPNSGSSALVSATIGAFTDSV